MGLDSHRLNSFDVKPEVLVLVSVGAHKSVLVEDIELDRSNPRIRKFLEMYGDEPTPEQIFLAPRRRQ